MTRSLFHARRARVRLVTGLIGLSAAAMLSGCAVPDGGYAYGGGFGANYYEPYGFGYGGWGPGYGVGPFRGSDHDFNHGGDHDFNHGGDHDFNHGGEFHTAHAYRSAPAGHAMPSIPGGGGHGGAASGFHGGAGHGGGGHGGGHGGH
jgi:hypothetical protein